MDCIRPSFLGNPDHLGDRQIRLNRSQTLANLVSLIRLEPMEAELVLLRVDSDCSFPQLIGRAHDADRNLAPIGDKDFLEVFHGIGSLAVRASAKHVQCIIRCDPSSLPNSTGNAGPF